MKNKAKAGMILATIITAACASACFSEPEWKGKGTIEVRFSRQASTKGSLSTLDTDEFTLTVTSAKGDVVYKGRYADSPEEIEVPAGTYTVSAYSREFEKPEFEAAQFGDSKVVMVQAGKAISVILECRQTNSGIRLNIDKSFMTAFPYGIICIKGSNGSLDYEYGELRTAYFKPGNISVCLKNDGTEETLFNRLLAQQDMLNVNISASVEGITDGHIGIQLDTNRSWTNENYCYGKGGSSVEGAYSIAEAKDHIGQKDAWVFGYVVGVFPSTGKVSNDQPFTKNTNLAIASRTSTTDSNHCMSAELQSGAIREDLNLVDNPENLGKGIFLRGDIVAAYYGVPGIKNITEYQWKK